MRDFLKIINKKRIQIYKDPDSILKKYDEYLLMNGLYHSADEVTFRKKLKGHTELCGFILNLYSEAKLENEKISLLEDLLAIGYDKNKLVELILSVFFSEERPEDLWDYGNLLYSLRKYSYMSQYLEIITNELYGDDRQMVILLVGKSKNPKVIPILIELLNDPNVYGHALSALSNFQGDEIINIMSCYKDDKMTWIQNVAKRYLEKNS